MKKKYPIYRDRVTTYIIEKRLPKDQKKILDNYISFLSSTASSGKVKDYRRYMLQFYDIIEKPLDKIEPQDITDFASLLNQDETRETNTKNVIKVAVKRFVKWQYPDSPQMIKAIENLNQKYVLTNEKKLNKGTLLKTQEIELLLRTANSLKLKAQVVVLYESACRPHELRNAKWKNIDWDRKTINLYASKTSKAREIPLDESMIHLKRWRQEYQFPNVKEEDYIFPSPLDRTKPIGRFEFTYWIRSLGKKAGLTRPVYPYLFRHTRLTELYNKYKLQDQVHKKFAGHSEKSDMTGVYVKMDDEDMIQSVISQVYHVEDLPPEKKHEFEKKIEELNKKLENNEYKQDLLNKKNEGNSIFTQLVVELASGKISKKEFQKECDKLREITNGIEAELKELEN